MVSEAESRSAYTHLSYREGEEPAIAVGWFVHVFVDRDSRRPVEITPPLRGALLRLMPAP